jgi:hypothetical protein
VRCDSDKQRIIKIPQEQLRDSQKIRPQSSSAVPKVEGMPFRLGGKPSVSQQDLGLVQNPPIQGDQKKPKIEITLKNISESMGF